MTLKSDAHVFGQLCKYMVGQKMCRCRQHTREFMLAHVEEKDTQKDRIYGCVTFCGCEYIQFPSGSPGVSSWAER